MDIEISSYIVLGALLFGIGAIGFLVRRNFLIQLMSVELMLNSVNLLLVGFNRAHASSHDGQVFTFVVIAIAAAEAALGLALAIAYYRFKNSAETDLGDLLRH